MKPVTVRYMWSLRPKICPIYPTSPIAGRDIAPIWWQIRPIFRNNNRYCVGCMGDENTPCHAHNHKKIMTTKFLTPNPRFWTIIKKSSENEKGI